MTDHITLDLSYASLSALRAGRGPRVLYVHDELDSGWLPFLDALAESCEVVAVELPGFGASERPEWAETIDDYAYIVADLADLLAADAPITLAGAGLGGWLAVEAAVRGAPAAALVAIGAPGVDIPGDPPLDYFVLLPHERAPVFFYDPEANAPEVDEDTMIRNESTTARLVWQPRYVNPALERRLHRVRAPALVLWGENDRFLSRAHGERLATGVARGEFGVVPASGHFPARENPAATSALARQFLQRALGVEGA